MKKLLLLINLLNLVFVFTSCQHTTKPEQVNIPETKSAIKDSVSLPEPTITENQTTPSRVAGTLQGKEKSTNTNLQKDDKAIIHLSSNQSKIDSIKSAKLKGKK